MLPIPADIFTEPTNVAPDDLANLGPLRGLAGFCRADKELTSIPKLKVRGAESIFEWPRSILRPTVPNSSTVALPHPHQHACGGHHFFAPDATIVASYDAQSINVREGDCR